MPPPTTAIVAEQQAQQKQQQQQQAFWGNLKIEIEPPYEGKPPEWHTEQSDSTSIPAHLSSSSSHSGSETDLSHLEGSIRDNNSPTMPEPFIAKSLAITLAGTLVLVGIAQLALQLMLSVKIHFQSAWWGGAFSVLVGSLGLATRWECTRMTHQSLVVIGILLNAVAAVLETRASSFFHGEELFCGPPERETGGVANLSVGEWCVLDLNLDPQKRTKGIMCACIIPGRDPESKEACVAFRGWEGLREGEVCDASAEHVGRIMNLSVALCWAMSTICLLTCLVRIGVRCHQRKHLSFCRVNSWVSKGLGRKKRRWGPTVVAFDRRASSRSSSSDESHSSRNSIRDSGLAAQDSGVRTLMEAGGTQARHVQLQQQQQQQQQPGGERKGKGMGKRKDGLTDPYYMRDQPKKREGKGGGRGIRGEVEMGEEVAGGGGGRGGVGRGGGFLPSPVN
ncbi:Hypothetical protein NocV09_00901640 [Nannochloropsis oceanica]